MSETRYHGNTLIVIFKVTNFNGFSKRLNPYNPASVTAPVEAEVTRLAYFASTPRV